MASEIKLPFFRDSFLGILREHGFMNPEIDESLFYKELPAQTRRQVDLCMARLKVEFQYDE